MYHDFIYQPLYNGLVFLLGVVPFGNVGVAVIVFTIIVKVVLFPLSRKFIKTQLAMKELQPEVDRIKEKYKDNKPEQAKKMMEVYKARGVNPFSGILLIIIQIPILFALYQVFYNGLPVIKIEDLYSFVTNPGIVNMTFLGWFDLAASKNIVLSLLVAVTQYFQARFMTTAHQPSTKSTGTFESDFARSMSVQTKYVLPVFIGVISYTLSGALAIYWITSNLFAIGQEVFLRRGRPKV